MRRRGKGGKGGGRQTAGPQALEELDLGANRFGTFGAESLGALLASGALDALAVRRCDLRAADVAAIAAGVLQGCRLKRLDLRSNKLQDSGAAAAVRRPRRDGCRPAPLIPRGGKAELLGAAGCPLLELDLQSNSIGGEGLEARRRRRRRGARATPPDIVAGSRRRSRQRCRPTAR